MTITSYGGVAWNRQPPFAGRLTYSRSSFCHFGLGWVGVLTEIESVGRLVLKGREYPHQAGIDLATYLHYFYIRTKMARYFLYFTDIKMAIRKIYMQILSSHTLKVKAHFIPHA